MCLAQKISADYKSCKSLFIIQWTLVTTTAFVHKDVAIELNLLLYKYLMSWLIHKKVLVLFFFPHSTYVLDICKILKIIKSICFFQVLNTIFLHNLWLIVASKRRFRYSQIVIIIIFCRCIECRYKEGCLYPNFENVEAAYCFCYVCCLSRLSHFNSHYDNTPIQIYRKFHLQTLKIFR